MVYDTLLIAEKLRRWEKYLEEYKLPQWNEIPNFGLYMEQVLVLLRDYLDYLPPELKDEQFITAAAINNYVRNKFMPEPQKKRYYRVHIAYLIMICTLKQSLSIGILQKIIPTGISEDEVKEIYTAYVQRHKITADYFIDVVKQMASPILAHKEEPQPIAVKDPKDLIVQSAVLGGLSKLLAEKLLLVDKTTAEETGKAKKSRG